jgi:hypothetical protein
MYYQKNDQSLTLSYSKLQLFPSTPFLENKLGMDQFADIPQQPGIYRFYDIDDTLLYVGKAKNLRKRLFTYKRASPGKTTRKEAKLIRSIHRFEYEVLSSEKEALLAENKCIRKNRPEYNHQNKHIETYYFIIFYKTSSGFGLEYSMRPAVSLRGFSDHRSKPDELSARRHSILEAQLFGCFKGHRKVRIHLGHLLRLLWLAGRGKSDPLHLPLQLTRNLAPKRYFFNNESLQHIKNVDLYMLIEKWFKGKSPDLVYMLVQCIQGSRTQFQNRYFMSVADFLFSYFDRALVPYGQFISERSEPAGEGIIYQDEIDDLFIRYKTV